MVSKAKLCGSVEGFVGRAEDTSSVGLQNLQVCPMPYGSLPEASTGLLAGGWLGVGRGSAPRFCARLRRVNQLPAGPSSSPLAPLAPSVGRLPGRECGCS